MKHKVYPINDRLYLLIKPVKSLVRSTTIYEVITRGDQFALDIESGTFTVLQRALVASTTPREYELDETIESMTVRTAKAKKARKKLKDMQEELDQLKLGLTE